MNIETYKAVKAALFAVPSCPDSAGPLACASCLAEALAKAIEKGEFQ